MQAVLEGTEVEPSCNPRLVHSAFYHCPLSGVLTELSASYNSQVKQVVRNKAAITSFTEEGEGTVKPEDDSLWKHKDWSFPFHAHRVWICSSGPEN